MTAIPRHRTVADVMTRHVHVATPATPFKELVRLIQENRISAVPIVDRRGMPVGVVSESDLLLKEELADLAASQNPIDAWRRRKEQAKARGVLASELMTSPAISVGLDTTVNEAARVMQQRRIRRLIVVDNAGRIAGIVSRSDLLQVFQRTDDDLREELVWKVIPALFTPDAPEIEVRVAFNVITLFGEVDRRSDSEILGRVASEIDGAVSVVNNLTYRWDDVTRQSRQTDLRATR